MSAPRRYLVDTNILLRFLSGEPPALAAAARKLFSRAKVGEVILDISPVIVAETYYTLTSYYKVERKVAAERTALLLQQGGVKLRDSTSVLSTLAHLQTSNIDFADAYLIASAQEEKLAVASFDRDFDKFKGVTRYEPCLKFIRHKSSGNTDF